MSGVVPGALGAAAVLGLNVAYLAYTLGGLSGLRPVLGRARRGILAVALGGVGVGIVMEPGPATGALAAVALAGATYMALRQWLLPRAAPTAEPRDDALPPESLLVVLPDGAAVPLVWLTRVRTAVWSDWWIVHCALSRSVAAFERPGSGGRPRATLPHASGFDIGDGTHEWDGVDGTPRGSCERLHPCPISLMTFGAWCAARKGTGAARVLLGPPASKPLPAPREITPRVPGARGIEGAMDWGAIDGESWRPVALADVRECPSGAALGYLARWAARVRGLAVEASDA